MTGGEILSNLSDASPFLFPQMEQRAGIIKRGALLIVVIIIVIFMFIKNKD